MTDTKRNHTIKATKLSKLFFQKGLVLCAQVCTCPEVKRGMTNEPFHILVVCTGNICRSPMAEGLIQHVLSRGVQDNVSVSSAGTDALHGNQAADLAIEAMRSYGIDISYHRARRLSRTMVADADLILAMEIYHLKVIQGMKLFGTNKVRLIAEFDDSRESNEIPDPYGGPMELYLKSAEQINDCLRGIQTYVKDKYEK